MKTASRYHPLLVTPTARANRISTASSQCSPANRLAPIVHCGFYVLVVLMAGTGFATALAAGLPEIVFAGSGAPLRASRVHQRNSR